MIYSCYPFGLLYFFFVQLEVAYSSFYGSTEQKTPEEAMEVPPQSHGNSKIEVMLIVASTAILVILAIPTLQGVVLMNRLP